MPGKQRLYVFWTLSGSMPTWRCWFVFVLLCDLDIEEALYHTRQNDSNAQKKGLGPLWANHGLDWLCLLCLSVTSDSSRVIFSILDRLCQRIRGHKEAGGRCAAWLCNLPNLLHFAFLALSLIQFPTQALFRLGFSLTPFTLFWISTTASCVHFFGSWKIDIGV